MKKETLLNAFLWLVIYVAGIFPVWISDSIMVESKCESHFTPMGNFLLKYTVTILIVSWAIVANKISLWIVRHLKD